MESIINFQHLLSLFGEDCLFYGNKNLIFNRIQSIYDSEDGNITWVKPGVKDEDILINETKATCILCNEASFNKYKGIIEHKLFVINDDPKKLYLFVNKFIEDLIYKKEQKSFIHPTAIVDINCKIGEKVQIGAYSIIGACEIGDFTSIDEHVKIYDCVKIGKKCKIREFTSIGGNGLGYYRGEDGTLEHIPHIGNVIIEDNVHIYPFVNIDQGTLSSTKIGKGSAIDHHVHIAHNCSVGENSILVCGTVMAGGSKVLNGCFIGGNTQIKEKCIIGSNVTTGMGSVVIKDIPDNEIWAGIPAVFLKKSI
jgi:UDP-3-O-[3-hydroxymyristoyl] glucosamine N-acyltransferase LpxD